MHSGWHDCWLALTILTRLEPAEYSNVRITYGKVLQTAFMKMWSEFHTDKIHKLIHHFPAVAPPSIGSAAPLINPASFEAKNKVAAAASSRVPILCSG